MNDNIESPTAMAQPTKGLKFKSDVWTYFERIEDLEHEKLVPKNKCSICGLKMKGGSGAGTSHLRRHIKIHEESQLCQTGQMQISSNSAGILTTFAFDKLVARKEVVDFVVRSKLPFTFVEKHDFKGMIQRAFCPQYKGISATTCKRDVMRDFEKGKVS